MNQIPRTEILKSASSAFTFQIRAEPPPPKSAPGPTSKAQPRRRGPGHLPERNWPPAATPAQRPAGQTHIMTKITLPQAAVLLHVPDYTCRRLALRGALGPIENVAGRWLLDAVAV